MTKEPNVIGRPPLIRQTNAQLLLKLLRAAGPCSRADLVRASGLSAPSVTNVVDHLASAGLVEPLGEGDSTGGRPPDILRFRSERGCVSAVEIGPSSLDFLIADLNGRELGRSRIPIQKKKSTPHGVCAQIRAEVRRLLRNLKHLDEQLLGLAVGVPAIVDVDEGVVLAFSPLKGWTDVRLGDLLRSEFKCAVSVENDTNLAAQGEFHRGAAQGEKNFVYITIGEGVGAGIFVDGNLHHGAQWSAGEIGYLRVPNISREHPAVYKYGKLEKALGSAGILRNWKMTSHAARTSLKVKCAADIFDLAAAGNSQARKVLKQRAIILADVVVDLGVILNPSLILLGGDVGNHPALLQEVQNLLKGSEFGIARVGLSALGSSAVLWGAIHTALDPAILSLL